MLRQRHGSQFSVAVLGMTILVCGRAVEDVPIPSNWQLVATTVDKPIKEVYLGGIKNLSYLDPAKRDPNTATYSVWGKFVYIEPQTTGKKTFTTDIINIKLDCNTERIMTLREVLEDASGKIVSDNRVTRKGKKVDPRTSDLSVLPIDENIALSAWEWACEADDGD